MNITKEFSPELYAQNDARARNLAKEWLASTGAALIVDNPDQYGVDVLFARQAERIECETKHNWKGLSFPFATVQVLYRKKKYFDEGATLFLTNSDCTAFMLVGPADILAAPIVTVKNKYVPDGEQFFDVPLSAATLVVVGS